MSAVGVGECVTVKIGSNIPSLQAQRRLGDATSALSDIYARLSSGQRINKASDDAGGLSIAMSLNTSSRILSAGIRNLNDSISLVNVESTALGAMQQIVGRQRELAEQSANGVYSAKQREAINKEALALDDEYNRIVQGTTFNGRAILSTPWETLQTQAGTGAENVLSFTFADSLMEKVNPGDYFTVNGVSDLYYVWFNVDGQGTDPGINGMTGLRIDVSTAAQGGTADGASIASSAATALTSTGKFTVQQDGSKLIITNTVAGRGGVTDNNTGTILLEQLSSGAGRETLSTNGSAYGLASGDLNGDGYLDLASADSTTNTLSVFLNNGDGTFASRQTVQTGTWPDDVRIADLNGDGLGDLLASEQGSSRVSVFLNRGDGTFRSAGTYACTSVNDVDVGDFNGDGKLDLVAPDWGGGKIRVFMNNGDGTFGASTSYVSGTNPIGVSTADFDGDGKIDIVAGNYGASTISVFRNNGDGTFAAAQNYADSGASYGVVTGDLNGDGLPDIVSANGAVNKLSVFINNGNGTFSSAASYFSSAGPSDVAIADINGDGRADMIAANVDSNTLTAFINNGDGTFKAPVSYATGTTPRGVVAGDFNSDGMVDLASVDYASKAVSIRFKTGTTTFEGDSGYTKTALVFGDARGSLLVNHIDLSTQIKARLALDTLADRANKLSTQIGILGSTQSRFAVVNNVLTSSRENFLTAESRIRDADIAQESARLVSTQILQQAASSVLAQANQAPSLALMLLR